jgi:hypothetical protein
MYRLDDIYHASRRLIAGAEPHALPTSESPTFNMVWKSFVAVAKNDVRLYSSLWYAVRATILKKRSEVLSAKSIRQATHNVATAYILAGFHSAERQGEAIIAPSPQDLAQKLLVITHISRDIRIAKLPVTRDGTLPHDVRDTLGEFYSLCIFAYQQLRPNVPDAFHEGIGDLIKDFKAVIANYHLPHFLHTDDRIKIAGAPQGTAPLPTRTGIVADTGHTAQIYDLRALRSTTGRRDI